MDTHTSSTVEIDGEVLRDLRDKKFWSQQQLADQAGINIATVNRLERGKRENVYRRTALRLAAALGVAVEVIIKQDPCE